MKAPERIFAEGYVGHPIDQATCADNFKRMAASIGLQVEDLGRKFTWRKDEITLLGYDGRDATCPIVGLRPNQTLCRYSIILVQRGIIRPSARVKLLPRAVPLPIRGHAATPETPAPAVRGFFTGR